MNSLSPLSEIYRLITIQIALGLIFSITTRVVTRHVVVTVTGRGRQANVVSGALDSAGQPREATEFLRPRISAH